MNTVYLPKLKKNRIIYKVNYNIHTNKSLKFEEVRPGSYGFSPVYSNFHEDDVANRGLRLTLNSKIKLDSFEGLGKKFINGPNFYRKPEVTTITKNPKQNELSRKQNRIGEKLDIRYFKIQDGGEGVPTINPELVDSLTTFFIEMSDECFHSRFNQPRDTEEVGAKTKAMVKNMLINLKGIILLQNKDGKIVGMANYSRDDIMKYTDEESMSEVSYVITDADNADYQGYGIGSRLLEILINNVRYTDFKVRYLYANFTKGNNRSRDMFRDVAKSCGLGESLIELDLEDFILDVRPPMIIRQERSNRE